MYRISGLFSALLPVAAISLLAGCVGGEPSGKDSGGTSQDDSTTSNAGDEDGDGFTIDDGDCDDSDPAINPDAEELCDGIDNDCDGEIEATQTMYEDADGDGFGDPRTETETCETDGLVDNGDDCDDDDRQINPDARDVCDGVDNNCDGQTDEDGQTTTWYADNDGDGYGDSGDTVRDCAQPDGYVADDGDCNDQARAINPGAAEVCDGIDNDCDGLTDNDATDAQIWYNDRDQDGYGDPNNTRVACDQPSGYIANNTDCSDTNDAAYPGATEVCDGADNDCDGQTDEAGATGGTTYYADADSDGFGNANSSVTACTQPAGYVTASLDCDDGRATVNPGASETCNSIDDDCDGTTDENATDATLWFDDNDGDGFGDPATNVLSCTRPAGYVSIGTDCNDAAVAINPNASEVCDGTDNDCDGGVDNNAVGATTWYADSDSDGYGGTRSQTACNAPAGYVSTGGDCNDSSAASYPGATEVCDLIDNDCDGVVDDGATDFVMAADDADGDGFGAPGSMHLQCGGVDNELDCDDADSLEPVVVDVINGSAAGTGTTASPFASIQDGIDSATACVVVYPGSYAEAIDFGGNSVSVVGIGGSDDTVIDASGTGSPAVTFATGETSAAVLAGFTLRGGQGYLDSSSSSSSCGSSATCTSYYETYCGGGAYISGSSPTMIDVLISENVLPLAATVTNGNDTTYTSSYGGGVCLMNSATLDASSLTFLLNYADQGGGIYVDGTSTLDLSNTSFQGNRSTDGGAINSEGAVTLTNVVSAFNQATGDGGGLLMVDAALTMTNVTFAGDTGTALYLSGTTSTGTVRNSIIYDASAYGVLVDAGSSFTGTYNNVYLNTSGNYSGTASVTGANGNISAVPGFTAYTDDGNLANDNFHLATGAACINAGNPSAAYNDVDATRNDIGAYGGPGGGW